MLLLSKRYIIVVLVLNAVDLLLLLKYLVSKLLDLLTYGRPSIIVNSPWSNLKEPFPFLFRAIFDHNPIILIQW